jgi:hypothetical protein
VKPLSDLAIWPIFNQPQSEQLALGLGKVSEGAEDRRRERQTIIDGLVVAVHDRERKTQGLASGVLHPPLAKRGTQHVVGDAIQPRQRRALMLISEPVPALPRQSKDLGSQISAILPHPGARPSEDLADVSVVKLGKGVRILRAQEIGVRQPRPRAHDLYMTAGR